MQKQKQTTYGVVEGKIMGFVSSFDWNNCVPSLYYNQNINVKL